MDELGFKILKGLGLLLLAIAAAVSVADYMHRKNKEDQQWEQFKSEHRCLLIAQSFSGDIGYKQAWFCNNAITYYR